MVIIVNTTCKVDERCVRIKDAVKLTWKDWVVELKFWNIQLMIAAGRAGELWVEFNNELLRTDHEDDARRNRPYR